MDLKTSEQLIDVRALPARERHPRIFEAWASLEGGGAMLLVNDHDPLPLYYQFAAEHAGSFHWEYEERGPEVWRVRIRKGHFCDPGFRPNRRAERPAARALAQPHGGAEPHLLDTRPIFARGETPCHAIDEAVAALHPGQRLVLLVPFEPVPLYAKLGAEGFTHCSEQLADGTWRVEFSPGGEPGQGSN